MTFDDLITQLEARLAPDILAIRHQAKYEDSDGYFGFISGAEWTHVRLAPIHKALVELVAIQLAFNKRMSPGDDWLPELRDGLDNLKRAVGEGD